MDGLIAELENIAEILFNNGYNSWGNAIHKAIKKMKEHEAKLLTFDEVKKHYSIPGELLGDIKKYIDYSNDIEPLYVECQYEDAWVVHWRDYHNISMHLDTWKENYGKTWRCWTAKPTAEQRTAAKWN